MWMAPDRQRAALAFAVCMAPSAGQSPKAAAGMAQDREVLLVLYNCARSPGSHPCQTQAIMVGRCLGRDDRRSTLPVRHHQAVIEDASAVQFVGVESPRG